MGQHKGTGYEDKFNIAAGWSIQIEWLKAWMKLLRTNPLHVEVVMLGTSRIGSNRQQSATPASRNAVVEIVIEIMGMH